MFSFFDGLTYQRSVFGRAASHDKGLFKEFGTMPQQVKL
jgi:hypothetical protein